MIRTLAAAAVVVPLAAICFVVSAIPATLRAAEPFITIAGPEQSRVDPTRDDGNLERYPGSETFVVLRADRDHPEQSDGVGWTYHHHPDIAPTLDLARSCSFVRSDDPTIVAGLTNPIEAGNGDCSNKAAVQDRSGHGTHVASTIASPINGIGIAGVAPDATIVALKACTESTYCYGYAVADALRYAGDIGVDVVNMSLFADPYLFYCGNDAGQRAMLRELQSAARYAQQHGVLLVASAGNETIDAHHPGIDDISPDGPDDTAEVRDIGNNCRVAPAEIPGVLAVSATGPFGIADYSTTGMSVDGVAAPGGDYFQGLGVVQTAILAAASSTDNDPDLGNWPFFDFLNDNVFPGLTVVDQTGARYILLNGTSMASPHAAGVAALVRQMHPNWSPGAVIAAVQRSAQPRSCPAADGFTTDVPCQGQGGRTSYFGHGLVDALAAAQS